MGFFDKVVSMLGDKVSGETAQGGLFEQVVGLINNPETGGLSGLISKFENGGLGDVVSSWVGTGTNAPVSDDQITNTLGPEKIQEIAAKLGISNSQVSGALATLLPQIIDKLTPDGKVPESNTLAQSLGSLLQTFTKG
ncbi:MAG: hypothetical protein CVU55_00205 [Deltaproteobacteria bacterium HGW-Deltaproteobacteria-13]|nr:MAG: hypothetical protein CVU55_00205 [Deltaproteobacteria bacterium HGW-Deltaproteobacteria-13]